MGLKIFVLRKRNRGNGLELGVQLMFFEHITGRSRRGRVKLCGGSVLGIGKELGLDEPQGRGSEAAPQTSVMNGCIVRSRMTHMTFRRYEHLSPKSSSKYANSTRDLI